MSAAGWTTKPGVVMTTAHDLAPMVRIREAAVATAPELKGPNLVVITEAWRPPRRKDGSDAHTWCLAFDFRVRDIVLQPGETRTAAAEKWVAQMRAFLGSDPRFQFLVHGKGSNLHIHAEFDPRKVEIGGGVLSRAA